MTSLLFPDAGSRRAEDTAGRPALGKLAVVYADSGGTTLATIYADNNGAPGTQITTARLTTDAYGMLPLFWGPADGTDKLYVSVNSGPVWPVNADTDPRLDDLADRVATLVTGLAGKVATGSLVVNVKDYGATGDGTTDDTTALNTCITAAPAGSKIFFPPGTYIITKDGTGNMLRIDKQRLELFGAGRGGSTIKVKNSTGDYESVITNKSAAGANVNVSGFGMRDLTVDQNSANNPIVDPSPTGPLFTGSPRYAVRVFSGFDVTIANCRFTNGDTVNTVAGNGGYTLVGRWAIRNCLFDNVGNGAAHDHSTIYFHGDTLQVVGNTFVGGGNAATTAVETHGANQTVTGNVVRDFATLANITGVAASSNNLVVVGNIGTGLGLGIHLWAYDYAGLTGPAIERLIVAHNQIEIDYDKWSATLIAFRAGILLNAASTGVVKNAKIHDNQIRYKTFANTPTSTDNQSAGILWYRTVAVTNGTEETDLDISRNHIEGSLSAGIYVTPNIVTKRLNISDNTIINPGMGAPNTAYRVGIFLATLSAGLHDATVNRNVVVDTNATHRISAAVDTQFTDSLTNGRAVDNQVRCTDGTNLTVHAGDPVVAWYGRWSMPTWVQPSGAWTAGSAVVETGTGLERRQSATPSGSTWTTLPTSLAGAVAGLFSTSRYYTVPAAGRSTAAAANGAGCAVATPLFVGQAKAFDRIGCEITTAAASSTVRLGIYTDSGSGSPSTLVVDAGTVDSTTTGAKEAAFTSGTLSPGLYWLVLVPQGGSPTFRAITGGVYPCGGGSLATVTGAGGTFNGLVTDGAAVTGALPSTFPAINNYSAITPLVAVRSA